MRVGLELYELIKSLTPTEDVAVKSVLPKKKAEMYFYFRDMDRFASSVVKARFAQISDQNRSTTERQLIDMILDILWNNIYKHGVRDLIQHLGEAEILMKRALYSLAYSKIRSAIKKAIAMDAMHELLIAIRMKRELIEVLQVSDYDPKEESQLSQSAVVGMLERLKMDDIHLHIAALRNTPILERKSRIKTLREELELVPYPNLRRNKVCYHRCKHFLSYLEGELSVCEEHCKNVLEIVKENEEILGDPQVREDHYNSLHFLIAHQIENNNLSSAAQLLARFEEIANKWSGGVYYDPAIQGRYTHAILFLNISKKDWSAVEDLLRKSFLAMRNGKNGVTIRHKPTYLQMTLLAAFVTENYDLVRRLAVDLRQATSIFYAGNAFLSGIAVYYLAALYEEKDEFLETATKQTKRWLKENKCTGSFDLRMMRFFEKASKEATLVGRTSLLKSLKTDLDRIFSDSHMWRYRDFFPVFQWIEAKIQRVQLRQVLFV
jgi:tetratricopeptide (TPR) repeat protein